MSEIRKQPISLRPGKLDGNALLNRVKRPPPPGGGLPLRRLRKSARPGKHLPMRRRRVDRIASRIFARSIVFSFRYYIRRRIFGPRPPRLNVRRKRYGKIGQTFYFGMVVKLCIAFRTKQKANAVLRAFDSSFPVLRSNTKIQFFFYCSPKYVKCELLCRH